MEEGSVVSTPSASIDRSPRSWSRAVLLALALAVLLWCFWSFLRVQWRWVASDPTEWGHTVLAPLGAVWLAWMGRRRLPAVGGRGSWIAPVMVLLGAAWFCLATVTPASVINSHNSRGLGVVLAATGLAAAWLGAGSLRILWVPALYLLVFGQCLGSRFLAPITLRLQEIAAAWGYHLVGMLGWTAERHGTVISVLSGDEWHPVNVAEACSGIRMLPAVLAAMVPLSFWILDRAWTRATVLLATLLITLVFNALRIVFMALLATWDSRILEGDLHASISDVWALPVVLIALAVAWGLTSFNRDDESSEDPPPTWRLPSPAMLVACFALLGASAIGLRVVNASLGIEPEKLAAPLRSPLSTLPTRLGGWSRIDEDVILDAQMVEVLGTPHYLERRYRLADADAGDPTSVLRLHVAFYTGDPDEAPHVPEICWVGQGLTIEGPAEIRPLRLAIEGVRVDPELSNRDTGEPYPLLDLAHPVTGVPEVVALPVGDLSLRISRFVDPADARTLHLGGYLFIANGRATPRAGDVRSLAFQLYQRHAYWMKVEFDAAIPRGPREGEMIDAYVARVESLLSKMLPELMRRLPDWPSLERSGASAVDAEP